MVRLVPPLVPPPLCPPPLLPAQGLSLTHSQLNSSQPNPLLSPSEAVLILTLHGPPLFPTSLLHTFGGVRSLRLIDPSTFIVEYWDERDAERAAEVLEGKTVGTTRLRCSFEPSVASTGMPVVQVESQVQPQVYRSPARRSQGQEPFGSIGNTLEARTRSYAPRSQGVKGGKSSQVDGYTSPVRFSPSVTNGELTQCIAAGLVAAKELAFSVDWGSALARRDAVGDLARGAHSCGKRSGLD